MAHGVFITFYVDEWFLQLFWQLHPIPVLFVEVAVAL